MTGRGSFNPYNRGETPQERVDDLIEAINANPNAGLCEDLKEALQEIPITDLVRRAKAAAALAKC